MDSNLFKTSFNPSGNRFVPECFRSGTQVAMEDAAIALSSPAVWIVGSTSTMAWIVLTDGMVLSLDDGELQETGKMKKVSVRW